MRKVPLVCLAVALLGGCLFLPRKSGFRSFQLVYGSDTQGFYRPCG